MASLKAPTPGKMILENPATEDGSLIIEGWPPTSMMAFDRELMLPIS